MRHFVILLVAVGLVSGTFLVDPIAQDEAYHRFADTREYFGVPNFWNVMSNLLFAYVGISGLRFCAGPEQRGILSSLRFSCAVFFAGVLLTAFGSAWYHFGPGIDSLVWDRLPMTLAFMSLFSLIIGEQISERLGKRMLLPLLMLGVGSVVYWWMSEIRGQGDLRPYLLVQFLPVILIPMMLVLYKSVFDRTGFIWLMIVLYAAAKLFEHMDYSIFAAGHLISGHSIKHVIAALATLLFLHGLKTRVREAGVSLQPSDMKSS